MVTQRRMLSEHVPGFLKPLKIQRVAMEAFFSIARSMAIAPFGYKARSREIKSWEVELLSLIYVMPKSISNICVQIDTNLESLASTTDPKYPPNIMYNA